MSKTVLLKCTKPGCPRQKRVPLDESDPPETTEVHVLCPWHDDGGGFPETFYYDASGKQILPQ